MVTHKTPASVGRTSPSPKLDRGEDRALDAKRTQVLGKLGLSNPNDLPPSAKSMLESVLEGNKGRLEVIDPEDLARRLRDQSAVSFGEIFRPSFEKPDRLPIPGNLDLTKERKDKQFQVQGSLRGDEHPVNRLMKDLDINPSAFGPEVKAVIDRTRGADLGHGPTWNDLVRDLAVASVKDKPLAALGKEEGIKGARLEGATAASMGLGLEKTAKTHGEKEARLEDSPELMMNSEKVRNPGQEERRAEAVVHLQGALADAGLSKAQLEDFGPVIDKVLRQGQLRGSPTEKAWAIVGNIAMVRDGRALPKDTVVDSPEGRSVTCLVAAAQLLELAGSKYGVQMDTSRADGVGRILEGYVGTSKDTKKSSSKLRDLGKGAKGAKPTNGPKGKSTPGVTAAHEQARRMGFDPAHPATQHTIKDIETAFTQVIGDGKKSDADVAIAGVGWLEQNAGNAHAGLRAHVEGILGNEPKDPALHEQMRQFVMSKVALCAAAGKDGYLEMLARSGVGGPPNAGGAGAMAGMMGPGGLPGAAAGVFDKYGVTNPLMRQAMGAAILHDPALSHEDRITLLLMLITQNMDKDRLRKMDELTELDRKDAAKAKLEAGGTGGEKPPEGAEGATPPAPPEAPPANAEPQKARDVVMFELDRIGKMRDQIFTALMEIIKKKDESVRGVLQSMQR